MKSKIPISVNLFLLQLFSFMVMKWILILKVSFSFFIVHVNIESVILIFAMSKATSLTPIIFLVEEPVGMIKIMSVVLGVLTVFLTIVIIVLAVKNRKLQTGTVDL